MLPEKLVIIDYCGTLSLEATRFGRPENLVGALKESGLAALGVSTPEAFWQDIVDPTWVEGSTTAIGYARVMARRIASLGLAPGATTHAIQEATSRFVSLYLASSRIDPGWRPVLARLNNHPAAVTVVATDHYAEATGKITGYLDSWGIAAQKIGRGGEPLSAPQSSDTFAQLEDQIPEARIVDFSVRGFQRSSRFFIANSADLGAWKQDPRFWEILRSQPLLVSVRRILLIDDFGFNEAPGDSYGERAKVLARQEETVAAVKATFQAVVEGAPFELPEADWGSDEAARFIEKTAARIDTFLESRR
jgi:hypothetical protein